MDGNTYDLIIVGGGPAGLTAAVYAGRYLLTTLVIGEIEGGTISEAYEVCNFPTYKSISGMELAGKMVEQVRSLGVEVEYGRVEKIKKDDEFSVETSDSIHKAKKIILAVGRRKRLLNVKGEKEFLGKGVSYCATCDASFFRDSVVAVVGGSDAALTAALLLSEYARKVYIVYRKSKFFRAEPAWIKQVEEDEKIEPVFNSNIKEIKGLKSVGKIILESGKKLDVNGVFIEIGYVPDTTLPEQLKIKMENGYVVVDEKQGTSVEGVYAAGDATNNPLKQAVTASAEGAIAATSAYEQIKRGRE